jgi:hypothetical protein
VRAAIVLSQFRLLGKQHTEYVQLATDVLMPYLVKTWKPRTDGTLDWAGQDASGLTVYTLLALAPLASSEFFADLREEEVRWLLPRCNAMRERTKEPVPLLGLDLILERGYGRVGQEKDRQDAEDRVGTNAARKQLLPPNPIKNPVGVLREEVGQTELLLEMFRGR